jgi:hypothetical protein
MATVLESCATEEHRSVVRFLWAKVLNAKVNHKETFPVYGGKCFSLKAVHRYIEKCGKCFADVEDVNTDLGSNSGRRVGKPTTNRLSYGTACMYFKIFTWDMDNFLLHWSQ